MKKSLLIGIATVGILGSSLAATSAMAQSATAGQGHMTSMVQALAEKLGISEASIQEAFDEVREEKHAERQAEKLAQLDQFVEDGSITEEQKQLIIAKQAELQTSREAQKESDLDMSQQERQAARESEREALENWANDNGIDMQYLMTGRGKGGHGGRGGHSLARPATE